MAKEVERKHEAERELLRDGVHRNELIAEIIAVLGKAEEQQLRIILRFAKRIIE